MAKAKIFTDSGGWEQIEIFCPGCNCSHAFTTKVPPGEKFTPWDWNRDFNIPTFSPSMLVNASHADTRCHSFVTDGRIQFLGDCYHELKGQTVDLPEIDLNDDE
jgi:hypothetical protein